LGGLKLDKQTPRRGRPPSRPGIEQLQDQQRGKNQDAET